MLLPFHYKALFVYQESWSNSEVGTVPLFNVTATVTSKVQCPDGHKRNSLPEINCSSISPAPPPASCQFHMYPDCLFSRQLTLNLFVVIAET